MHLADLAHDNPELEDKLHFLYNLKKSGRKVDLGLRPPYLQLLHAFGNPHQKLPPVIHVAGTNGKGSVIAMLRAILEDAGYRVHVYTSPHLHKFNERIRIAGKLIDDEKLEKLIDRALALNENRETTFFEITTAMALAAFAENPADIVLLETGLGGRLDCTNIIEKPLLSIITSISFDHMDILGNTLEKITAEKAGIIKPGVSCLADISNSPEVLIILKNTAEERQSPFHVSDQNLALAQPGLSGPHQIENARVTVTALDIICEKFPVTEQNIKKGLQNIDWPGRLQKMRHKFEDWEIWYDGGHNEGGGKALGTQGQLWQKQDGKPLHIITAMKADKEAEKFIAPLRPFVDSITLVPLSGVTCVTSLKGAKNAESLQSALAIITKQYPPGRILVCGSLYLAAPLAKALS